jgi:hypothetical protein
LYDELGLELSNEMLEEIDDHINEMIETDALGSETYMNALLATYGADISTLREAYIIETKMEQLKHYLYGENGSLIESDDKEAFYKLKYCRGYQILFANYYHAHARDTDGCTIYYTSDNRIAYDIENGIATKETDSNGDIIYRTVDGKIAYDMECGTPKYYYDQDGEAVIACYTDEEMSARLAELLAIVEECENNPTLFLKYAESRSDNTSFDETYAPNGMYFNSYAYQSVTILDFFARELAKSEIGEIRVISSESGYYAVMRVELDEGAWNNTENDTWFLDFDKQLVEYMFEQIPQDYKQYVIANENLVNTVDITDVSANYYY